MERPIPKEALSKRRSWRTGQAHSRCPRGVHLRTGVRGHVSATCPPPAPTASSVPDTPGTLLQDILCPMSDQDHLVFTLAVSPSLSAEPTGKPLCASSPPNLLSSRRPSFCTFWKSDPRAPGTSFPVPPGRQAANPQGLSPAGGGVQPRPLVGTVPAVGTKDTSLGPTPPSARSCQM